MENPLRSLFSFAVGLVLVGAVSTAWGQTSDSPFDVKEHVVFDQLGSQHLGNVVYREGGDGGYFVGWGRTPIQQWPFGSSAQTQVVPTREGERYSNGGTVLDVDGDGVEEVVVARGQGEAIADSRLYWFDPVEGQQHWEEHYIADTGEGRFIAPHDIEAFGATLPSGEEIRGVVGNIGRHDVFFLEIPDDPTSPWTRHEVGTFPVSESQSGMEIVDVNGDGRRDIVSGMFWIETPEDPRQDNWTFHRYGTWDRDNGRWGGMIMHGVADFDGDGQVEIAASEAEIPGARLAVFDRQQDDGTGLWNETLLEDNLYAPHSVAVADLDDDGQPDFIVGEMSAGGWDYTLNPNPKIYGYHNQGGQFERHTLSEGWGVHEMRVLPHRVDGQAVIYAADEIQPQKFDAMNTSVNYWLVGSRE